MAPLATMKHRQANRDLTVTVAPWIVRAVAAFTGRQAGDVARELGIQQQQVVAARTVLNPPTVA